MGVPDQAAAWSAISMTCSIPAIHTLGASLEKPYDNNYHQLDVRQVAAKAASTATVGQPRGFGLFCRMQCRGCADANADSANADANADSANANPYADSANANPYTDSARP